MSPSMFGQIPNAALVFVGLTTSTLRGRPQCQRLSVFTQASVTLRVISTSPPGINPEQEAPTSVWIRGAAAE